LAQAASFSLTSFFPIARASLIVGVVIKTTTSFGKDQLPSYIEGEIKIKISPRQRVWI
jgi:hypothetical protein